MSERVSELEVVVTDKQIEIWHRSRHFLSIGYIADEGLTLVEKRAVFHDDAIPISADKLDVIITTYERDELMALVKSRSAKASSRTIRASRSTAAQSTGMGDTVSPAMRDKILQDILTSFARNPHQTKAEITDVTLSIANKRNVGKFVVAGVRANLTRGAYGKMSTLINARKRELSHTAQRAAR